MFLVLQLFFKDIFIFNRSSVSQLVTLRVDSKLTPVLCHMGDFGCGGGGWTQVMKIDGNKVYGVYELSRLYACTFSTCGLYAHA